VVRDLRLIFEEQARLQKEAEEFLQAQDGREQQVPTGEIENQLSISLTCFYGEEYDASEDTEDDS